MLIHLMPGSRRTTFVLERDPELRLLVDLCRWPFGPAEQDRVRRQAAAIDWARLGRLVRRHRVEGVVHRALCTSGLALPPDLASALQQRALHIARNNLTFAANCRRLAEGFAEAKLRLLFVKGLTLGALVYGSIVPKAASDVDILIAPDELAAAANTLKRLGYRVTLPYSANATDLERWHRSSKESVWIGADGSSLELHTSLADHPALIPSIDVRSPQQSVEIATNVRLPTLARDELFAYLCVHGGSSAWFRLKWLADLAALLAGSSEEETSRLYENSQLLGAGKAPAAGLMLVHQLFGTPVAPRHLQAWSRDAGVQWLVHSSLKSLTGARGELELDRVPLGSIWIHVAQVMLVPSFQGKIGEIRRQWVLSRASRLDERSKREAVAGGA